MRHLRVLLLCVPLLSAAGTPGVPSLDLVDGQILVRGLSPDRVTALGHARPDEPAWVSILSVRTGKDLSLPTVLGGWTAADGVLAFTPLFPFSPGMTYHCRFDADALARLVGRGGSPAGVLERTFALPEASPTEPPRVEAFYPSGDVVPENLLRAYVHFDRPMAIKDSHLRVHLYDAQGRPVVEPFVEVRHGLWDPRQRRLTLLFHPGRIKRGVGPHEVMGPPLRRGETFRLVVDAEMRDVAGQPMAARFEKTFRVHDPDRAFPDLEQWRIEAPREPGDALQVVFPRPLDHALLHRLIAVETADGRRIDGTVTVGDAETSWEFTPAQPWQPGGYALRVDPSLEDVAGNRPDAPFEVRPEAPAPAADEAAPRRLPFHMQVAG